VPYQNSGSQSAAGTRGPRRDRREGAPAWKPGRNLCPTPANRLADPAAHRTRQAPELSAATIARLENVYRLKSGSIPRTLAGGPLETLDLVHGEPRPAVGTDDDHRDELRRAGLLADTAAALTGPAERQIRAEISMRGKRANAAALFNDRVERAMWRKLEFPEDVRVRQIAAYRLLCEAAESARKLARGTRAKPARRPARSTGNPPELAPWTSPSFAT
jgi:hypothetical protein